MKSALLIILLSNDGHWLSDLDYTASVAWAVNEPTPACDLTWTLEVAGVRLGGGKAVMKEGNAPTEISVHCPRVRARAKLKWSYRLVARKDGKELETDGLAVYAYPSDLTSAWASRVGRRRLSVCDASGALAKLFEAANVPFERVADPTKFRGPRPDVILVEAETIGEEPTLQAPLMSLASGGASAMIFRQSRPGTLAGFELTRRAPPGRFAWREDHPLLNGLRVDGLSFWTDHLRDHLIAVRLPQGATILEIGWWPTEAGDDSRPIPVDALLAVEALGKGRIVLCQIPLGDWNSDPRTQILLGNALDYLLTLAEPTPSLGQRLAARPAPRSTTERSISIPPGDRP